MKIEYEEKKENLTQTFGEGFSSGEAMEIVVSFQRNPPPNIGGGFGDD